MSETNLERAFSVPSGFRIREVSNRTERRAAVTPVAPLGPLAAFTGTFRGSGFNTIFRPDSANTPTELPSPVTGSDNVLELNLTQETLSFMPSLGDVPNRGTGAQADITLNGVPYIQSISDVTIPSQPVGIHFEPGLWMHVPATSDPDEGETVVRMASIPHGTTIEAQGTFFRVTGPPQIDPVDITPTVIATGQKVVPPFPSQTAAEEKTARIPQDLSPFITAGTITQDMLTDPNTFLRNHIRNQTIKSTNVILISTNPTAPLFGGGTDNIAFLRGNLAASAPNANAVQMTAQFWIETVEYTVQVPIFEPGQPPLIVPAQTGAEGQPVPEFLVNPPIAITAPRYITVTATQIQYSQQVALNFAGLSWPHVSMATLVPADPIVIPASAWT